MKKNIGTLSLAVLMGFMAVSPALAFAQDKDQGDNNPQLRPMMRVGEKPEFKGMGKDIPGMMQPSIIGIVSAVNGNTLTVSSRTGAGIGFGGGEVKVSATTTYSVDATNAKVIKNNATSSVASILVGDTVAIQGTITGTNVVAKIIHDGVIPGRGPMMGNKEKGDDNKQNPIPAFTGNGQPIVAGTVTSISSTTLTVTNKSNVTYTVNASSAKIIQGKNTVTGSLTNVKVGDTVVVQGTVNGTNITASTIIDQSVTASSASSTKPGKGNDDKPKQGFFGGIGSFFAHMFGF